MIFSGVDVMTKIKICGMMRPEDISAVNEAEPDYAGFIFAPGRRRTVSHSSAAEMRSLLSGKIKAVGVFLDNDINEIVSLCDAGTIDLIQLHGNENEEYIRRLRSFTDKPIIKAVSVRTGNEPLIADMLPVDYLLLDTYHAANPGGTGEGFDWGLIPELSKPFFLAGGIGTDNIRSALRWGAYGIDVSSGAETGGVKDRRKILELVKIVRGE